MFNNLLKRKRASMGYSQYQMADIIGISRQSYNVKENGKSPFTLEDATNLIKHLELTKDEVNDIFFNSVISK